MLQFDTITKMKWAGRLSRLLIASRALFGLSQYVRVKRGGINWNLDLNEAIDLSIYVLGRFELRTQRACEALLQRGDVVIDLGSNVGAYSLPFAEAVGPKGQVLAIDGSKVAIARFRKNLELNPWLSSRVRLIHGWVSSSADFAAIPTEVFSSWPLSAGPLCSRHPFHCGTVTDTGSPPPVILDALCEWIGNRRVSLIKIDLDGHEPEALEGAKRLIARYRPTICMEISPSLYEGSERQERFERMLRSLADAGYVAQDPWTTKHPSGDFPYFYYHINRGASRNVLFIPLPHGTERAEANASTA